MKELRDIGSENATVNQVMTLVMKLEIEINMKLRKMEERIFKLEGKERNLR